MKVRDLMVQMLADGDFDGAYEPDADGVFRLESDRYTVAFMETCDFPHPDADGLLVWFNLGPLPEDGTTDWAREMLRAQVRPEDLAYGTFSLQGEDVCFWRVLDVADLDVSAFEEAIGALVSVVEAWVERMEGTDGIR